MIRSKNRSLVVMVGLIKRSLAARVGPITRSKTRSLVAKVIQM